MFLIVCSVIFRGGQDSKDYIRPFLGRLQSDSKQLLQLSDVQRIQLTHEAIMPSFTPQPLPVSSLRARREDEMEKQNEI